MTYQDSIPNKVCPVVLRSQAGETEILTFRHPLEGPQLVKGTIEPGEDHEAAALRELCEESGIDSATIRRHLGIWDSEYKEQIWTFYLCDADGLDNEWTHRTEDDGGQDFEFFWHPINTDPDDEWHPVYRRALELLRVRIPSVMQDRDIDEIIRRVKLQLPNSQVWQLQVTHITDDDGIWYFSVPGRESDIQIESSFGMCPFLVETNEQSSYDARHAETVDSAVSMIVEYLVKPEE